MPASIRLKFVVPKHHGYNMKKYLGSKNAGVAVVLPPDLNAKTNKKYRSPKYVFFTQY